MVNAMCIFVLMVGFYDLLNGRSWIATNEEDLRIKLAEINFREIPREPQNAARLLAIAANA